jgi:hypothetical protein
MGHHYVALYRTYALSQLDSLDKKVSEGEKLLFRE